MSTHPADKTRYFESQCRSTLSDANAGALEANTDESAKFDLHPNVHTERGAGPV